MGGDSIHTAFVSIEISSTVVVMRRKISQIFSLLSLILLSIRCSF